MGCETTEDEASTTWQTIDYIGGGYVLQKQMEAIVEKTYRQNLRTGSSEFQSAEVSGVKDKFICDLNVQDWSTGKEANVTSVHQRHRVVHLSELEGVDMEKLVQEVEDLKNQNG